MKITGMKATRCALLAGLFCSSAIQAQSGFYLSPSVTLAALYDDNILFTPVGETDDVIVRLTPAIDMGYASERLSLQGIYDFDAEYYEENSELNDEFIRQNASLDGQYAVSESLNFGVVGLYAETLTPFNLNLTTGLAPGRVSAERTSVAPVLTYQMSQTTEIIGDYIYTNDKLEGGVQSDTHSSGLEINRQVNAANTLSFLYTYNRYLFDAGGAITSHVPMLGWSHQFNPNTSFTLAAGPRLVGDEKDAEVAFLFQHQFAGGEFITSYDRTQTTTIGERGTAETDRIGASLSYALGQNLNFGIGAYYSDGIQLGNEFEVYQGELTLDYEINNNVSLIGSFQHSSQEGNFGTLIISGVERSVAMIGIRLSL